MIDHKKIAVIGVGARGAGIKLAGAFLDVGSSCKSVGVILYQASEALELTTRCSNISMSWIDPNEPVFNERKHIETCTKNRIKRRNKKRK